MRPQPHKRLHGSPTFLNIAEIPASDGLPYQLGNGCSLLASEVVKSVPKILFEVELSAPHDVQYTSPERETPFQARRGGQGCEIPDEPRRVRADFRRVERRLRDQPVVEIWRMPLEAKNLGRVVTRRIGRRRVPGQCALCGLRAWLPIRSLSMVGYASRAGCDRIRDRQPNRPDRPDGSPRFSCAFFVSDRFR